MASPQSFWEGFSAAIIGVFITIFLFFIVALPSEKFVGIMEDSDVYDLPLKWGGYDNVSFWLSLMYIVIVSPAAIGIITMFLSAIKTQEYDVITDPETQSVPQYISRDELLYQQGRL